MEPWGSDPPMGRGNFWKGKRTSHCKVKGYSTVICAKTVEPIEMPFGLLAPDGPTESCGRWGSRGAEGHCHGNQFCDYNCYNWLCVNDSDWAIGYGRGLNGRPTKCRYCRYRATTGRCHGNHFWVPIYGCTLAPPSESTEPSMCGGDAALCHITSTTC